MYSKLKAWIRTNLVKASLFAISIVVLVFQGLGLGISEACTINNERSDMFQTNCEYSKAFPTFSSKTSLNQYTNSRSIHLISVAPKEYNESDWVNSVVDSVIGANETEQIISTDKRAAIRELLDNLDLSKSICSIIHSIITQIKQIVPIVESDILAEKQLTATQRGRVMQTLQKYCEKDICNNSIETLKTPEFWNSAVSAQCTAFSKYYTIEELKDLTTFYKSNVGRKFLSVQAQIGHDIMEELMRKYISQLLKNVRIEIEKEVRSLLSIIE